MPVMTQSDDPSWNYCNLAVSAVQQIGIRESLPAMGEMSSDSLVYFKTWLGCFVISTELVSSNPLPNMRSKIEAVDMSSA